MPDALTLASHALCPYVQRAAVVLREKGVPFERRWVDLAHKPAWFTAVSPLGKTPVLLVGDEAVFESAVICEYLDETLAPRLHPEEPLARARHRGWMEFGSQVLNTIGAYYTAPDEAERRTGEPRSLRIERRLQPREALEQQLALGLQRRRVRRRVVRPARVQHLRADLHPAAVPRAFERVRGMQPRRQRLVEVLADHGRLEHRRVADQQHRRLAQRRHGGEPRRLVGQVHPAALEGHALLAQHDRRALHVGAQRVAGENEVHAVTACTAGRCATRCR